MNEIIELTKIDFTYIFISVFAILIGVKVIFSLFEWIVEKFGLETKGMRRKKEEHDLLIQTSKNLQALQEKHETYVKHSDSRDEEISTELKELTKMFIESKIDSMRWEINNFATNVADGKPCNKDSFKHCLSVYNKYETLLEENGLENGEVEISMELINEAYKQKLKEGF